MNPESSPTDNFIDWEAIKDDPDYKKAYVIALRNTYHARQFPDTGALSKLPENEAAEIEALERAGTIEQVEAIAKEKNYPPLNAEELKKVEQLAYRNFKRNSIQSLLTEDSKIN